MEIRNYFERTGYPGPETPDEHTLKALHRAHLQSVPFENLDIHLRRPIVLEQAALYEKIVAGRRGGFCYELNGLFCALLRTLGFDVAMLSAGVAKEDGSYGPDFDHMALLVTLDRTWLADVGFGDSFVEPLQLENGMEQVQREAAYRVDQAGKEWILMRQMRKGPWQAQYRFTLEPRSLIDYVAMCRYHQTSPESSFTRKRVVTRATEEGRITLSEMRLITTQAGGSRRERLLSNDAEYRSVLADLFGIRL
jgi:N-hydroxyarylamine O-acetyltransferase